MASLPASNSEQFLSLQSTESLQPAPGQWRKAWSEHKEGKEEGKRNHYQRRKKKKKIFCKFQLSRGCTWSKKKQADLHKTIVQPLSRASPDHCGATCHSPSLQTSCSGLHPRQQILPGEEERHKQIQEEFFLKPQVTDFGGILCQADRLGPGEQAQIQRGKLPPCLLCSHGPHGARRCSWVAKAQHPPRRLGEAGSQQRQQVRHGQGDLPQQRSSSLSFPMSLMRSRH